MHLYLNFFKLYIDLFKYIIRGDNDIAFLLDAGDTLVSFTGPRLSYLVTEKAIFTYLASKYLTK